MQTLILPSFLLFGYLLGSLNGAHIISRIFYKKDISRLGTTNAGAGNIIKSIGIRAGVAVGFLDFIKGAVPILVGLSFNLSPAALLFVGSATISGHNWPIFFRFRGGRGTATLFGFVAAFSTQALVGITFMLFLLSLFPISGVSPFLIVALLDYLHLPKEGLFFLLGSITMLGVILIRRFQTEWDQLKNAPDKILALFNMIFADHVKTGAKNRTDAITNLFKPKFIRKKDHGISSTKDL